MLYQFIHALIAIGLAIASFFGYVLVYQMSEQKPPIAAQIIVWCIFAAFLYNLNIALNIF